MQHVSCNTENAMTAVFFFPFRLHSHGVKSCFCSALALFLFYYVLENVYIHMYCYVHIYVLYVYVLCFHLVHFMCRNDISVLKYSYVHIYVLEYACTQCHQWISHSHNAKYFNLSVLDLTTTVRQHM